jgi:hypothetical protein
MIINKLEYNNIVKEKKVEFHTHINLGNNVRTEW